MNRFLNLKRLEFAVTYNCSSKCLHCFVDEAKKKKYSGHIEKETAIKVVKDVTDMYQLESVMTFGGESLLYPDVTCAIHRTAAELGVPMRQIITNGYWAKNPERTKEIAQMVVDSGVNNLLFSIDAFHAPYVSTDMLIEVVQIFRDLGLEQMKWNPCWVKSKEDDNKYNVQTRQMSKEVEHLGLPIGNGNVVSPNGVAITNLAEFMPAKLRYPSGKCSDQPYTDSLDALQSISIEPNGDICVCPGFVIGNAVQGEIKETLENYDPYQVEAMKCILEAGMEGLQELAVKAGIQLNPEGYFTICEMCREIVGKTVPH